MAANGEIELTWADGQHKFNIAKLRCVLELEEKCNAGIAEVFQRIRDGRWKFNDIRETIRLGLIGGGMLPDKALVLVQRYVDDCPWSASILPAQAILIAAMVGVLGDNPEKKPEPERTKDAKPSEATAGTSVPSSMDLGQPSGSPRVN